MYRSKRVLHDCTYAPRHRIPERSVKTVTESDGGMMQLAMHLFLSALSSIMIVAWAAWQVTRTCTEVFNLPQRRRRPILVSATIFRVSSRGGEWRLTKNSSGGVLHPNTPSLARNPFRPNVEPHSARSTKLKPHPARSTELEPVIRLHHPLASIVTNSTCT